MRKVKEELKRVGEKYPLLLTKVFDVSNLSELEYIILKGRYIDGLLFKQIEYLTGKSERYVYRCHENAIKKTVEKFNILDLLNLMHQ